MLTQGNYNSQEFGTCFGVSTLPLVLMVLFQTSVASSILQVSSSQHVLSIAPGCAFTSSYYSYMTFIVT